MSSSMTCGAVDGQLACEPGREGRGRAEFAEGGGDGFGRGNAAPVMGGGRLVQAVAQLVEDRLAGCAWSDEALPDSVEVGRDGRFSRLPGGHARLPEAL